MKRCAPTWLRSGDVTIAEPTMPTELQALETSRADCEARTAAARQQLAALNERRNAALLSDDAKAVDTLDGEIAEADAALRRQQDRAQLLAAEIEKAQQSAVARDLDAREAYVGRLNQMIAAEVKRNQKLAADFAASVHELWSLDHAIDMLAKELNSLGRTGLNVKKSGGHCCDESRGQPPVYKVAHIPSGGSAPMLFTPTQTFDTGRYLLLLSQAPGR